MDLEEGGGGNPFRAGGKYRVHGTHRLLRHLRLVPLGRIATGRHGMKEQTNRASACSQPVVPMQVQLERPGEGKKEAGLIQCASPV